MNAPDKIMLLTIGSPLFPESAAREHMRRSASVSDCFEQVQVLARDRATGAKALAAIDPDRTAGLIVQLATFATAEILHDLLATIGDRPIPIALWALEEPGEIITNSLCGLQLWASTLARFERTCSVLIGDPGGPVGADIEAFAAAARAHAALRGSRIALIGSHADWFTNLAVAPSALFGAIGATIQQTSLPGFLKHCTATPQAEEEAAGRWSDTTFAVADEQAARAKMGRTYARLAAGLDTVVADAIAIRDWPEILYADDFVGTWGALGELSDRTVPIAPEGDVMAAVTALALRAMLPGSLPFLTDISGLDRANDRLVLWHYGVSPRLADGPRHVDETLKQESFPLKPGPMTLVRLSLRPDGALRIFVAEGEMLTERSGANRAAGYFRPDGGGAEAMVRGFVAAGYEHHVTAVYGRVGQAADVLAQMLGATLDEPGAKHG